MSTVEHAITILAPRSAVWRVLTHRELVREWAAAIVDGIDLQTRWRVGDTVTWKDVAGGPMLTGLVGAFERERLLRFDYEGFSDRWELGPEDGDLVLTYRRGPLEAEARAAFDAVGRAIVENVKSLAEELALLPRPWADAGPTAAKPRGPPGS